MTERRPATNGDVLRTLRRIGFGPVQAWNWMPSALSQIQRDEAGELFLTWGGKRHYIEAAENNHSKD